MQHFMAHLTATEIGLGAGLFLLGMLAGAWCVGRLRNGARKSAG